MSALSGGFVLQWNRGDTRLTHGGERCSHFATSKDFVFAVFLPSELPREVAERKHSNDGAVVIDNGQATNEVVAHERFGAGERIFRRARKKFFRHYRFH